MFTKYPRTYHFPWSPGLQNDDRRLQSLDWFKGQDVVVTEKMDGENTTLYRNHLHARSLDSRHHPSRDWVKMFHGSIKHDIPEWMRICGENMYAKHSIEYDKLDSYFLGFSIWDMKYNICMDWDLTLEWFELLGITPVRTIYRGPWEVFFNEHEILDAEVFHQHTEGYVVRTTSSFRYEDFDVCVGKYVRKDHIQTDQHWMQAAIVPNKLKDGR